MKNITAEDLKTELVVKEHPMMPRAYLVFKKGRDLITGRMVHIQIGGPFSTRQHAEDWKESEERQKKSSD